MSDTPRDFTITLAAAAPHDLSARGRFFGIIEAPGGPIDVQVDGGAPLRRGAGGSILLPKHFSRLKLTSTAAQSVRVLISDDAQDVSNIVAGSGGGGAAIVEQPSAAIATPAAVNLATAAASAIAANAARRRITVCALSTNTGSLFIQAAGAGAGRGIELQPGLFVELKTVAAFDVRNDSGNAQDFTTFEET